MQRTVKLPYVAQDAAFPRVLAELRRRQSRAMRSAYARLVDGVKGKELYRVLRAHPVGQGLHTWLLLSAMARAGALQEARPEGGACSEAGRGSFPAPRGRSLPWSGRPGA
jgi:hypothetical protein